MTDKNQDLEIMGTADEQMLRDFFEGFKEDIPDNGFSNKVMNRISVRQHKNLEHWWLAVCILMGIGLLASCPIMDSAKDILFASKISFMLQFSHFTTNTEGILSQSHTWLTSIGGIITILCVWGYNELSDAHLI